MRPDTRTMLIILIVGVWVLLDSIYTLRLERRIQKIEMVLSQKEATLPAAWKDFDDGIPQ